jgi:hypothetical protein
MRRFLRPPSPAMVVALAALIVALSTTAHALPGRGTVAADDIRAGAVGQREIRTNGVGAAELAPRSVGVSELRLEGQRGGGITGSHIVEASLGTVPNATAADRASVADRAATADGLAPPEAHRVVGAPGEPPFLNGCANVGGTSAPAAFFKDHQGVVRLRGAVTCPGTSQSAFQLPPGYRPPPGTVHTVVHAVASGTGGIGRVLVGGGGDVVAPNSTGAFWIDGIAFRAES